ncbi:MAG TPA: substrate-binding domain-containing protein [Acidimicrobiales bacterium]|nr:substrate-binding domain-containing protein [Acidimicrobiales bacterium]
MRRRTSLLLAAAVACLAAAPVPAAAPAAAAPAQVEPEAVTGTGSSYASNAVSEWKRYAGTRGWDVSYTVSNSVFGMGQYGAGFVDYAATEAEFSAYGVGPAPRGFQYTPTVAGAIAVMYNVTDAAGNQVTTLKLSRRTIARIFTGDIARWSDPAITADNDGRQLPDQPIDVIYRQGNSGTTALFYDFVKHTIPDQFDAWANRNGFDRVNRIIRVDTSPGHVAEGRPVDGSDTMTQTVKTTPWTISAVEASYPMDPSFNVPVAFVQNESGTWVRPGAAEITVALEGAGLRGDISQSLEAVYANPAPTAYPISAYSYMVTQCEVGFGPDCRGRHPKPGREATLALWMRYIACEGQAEMGLGVRGYAPLPPTLSQEIANSIARMTGGSPETLDAGNCGNPRFDPGFALPSEPTAPAAADAGAGGPATAAGGPAATTGGAGGAGPAADVAAADTDAATGAGVRAVGGGSKDWRDVDPASYDRPGMTPLEVWAWIVVLAALAVPLVGGTLLRLARRPRF